MATFPSYAKILLAGFAEEPDYGVLRTPTDSGIAKQRPTRSKANVTRDATILVLSRADKLLFDVWVKTDINVAGWFDWLDPLDGVTKKTRIVGGKYKWSSPGRIWLATCQLETIG
ncbi:MAG: hypothetical protein WBA83_16790 [Burkholderiaceae bacterium]